MSSFVSGNMLNKAYRNARSKQGLSTDKAAGDDLDSFAIEKARLSIIWTPMFVTTLSVVAFGWVLHYRKVRPSSCVSCVARNLMHFSISLFLSAFSSLLECVCSLVLV